MKILLLTEMCVPFVSHIFLLLLEGSKYSNHSFFVLQGNYNYTSAIIGAG